MVNKRSLHPWEYIHRVENMGRSAEIVILDTAPKSKVTRS